MNFIKMKSYAFILLLVLLFGTSALLSAVPDIDIEEHRSIGPLSVPADDTDAAPGQVGMIRLMIRRDNAPTANDASVDAITLNLSGSIPIASISKVYVFYEEQWVDKLDPQQNDGTYDQGSLTVGSYTPSTKIAEVSGPFTNPITISGMGASNTITTHASGNGRAYFYLAFDFNSFAGDSSYPTYTVNCEVTDVEYGAVGTGTGSHKTGGDIPAIVRSGNVNLDDYETSLTGITTGLNTGKGAAGDYVTALKLDFGIADTSLFSAPDVGGYVTVDRVRVHNVGTADDNDLQSVLVFRDVGADQLYVDGVDTLLGSGTVSGGYATVTLTTPISVYTGNDVYYVAVLLSSTANVGNTVGLRVEDPSDTTNLRFIDGFDDTEEIDLTGTLNPFCGAQYLQTGYILDTDPQPAVPDEFTIIPPDNDEAPRIDLSVPSDEAVNIDPYNDLVFQFSEAIDPSTLDTDAAGGYDDFSLVDLGAVEYELNGVLSYNVSTKTLRWSPDPDIEPPLPWGTRLTVTVGPDIYDFATPAPEDMDAPYIIDITIRPEFPEVNTPTVLKNRIGAGTNSEAVILIPTPSSGSFSGLSVQVFTTTGRLVKTFRGAEIETISSGRKILWDGTNDQGRNLGPGMYFVQVRVAGRKSVLKVMIVR